MNLVILENILSLVSLVTQVILVDMVILLKKVILVDLVNLVILLNLVNLFELLCESHNNSVESGDSGISGDSVEAPVGANKNLLLQAALPDELLPGATLHSRHPHHRAHPLPRDW